MTDTLQSGAESAVDLDKLEALACAANEEAEARGEWFNLYQIADGITLDASAALVAAANPVAVLDLIALARRATAPHAAPSDEQNIKAEFGEYVRWCADQGRKPMRFSAFKFAAQHIEAAGSAVQADQLDAARFRWLNADHDDAEVREQARDLAKRLGTSSYFAITRDIDAAMGTTHPAEAVGAPVRHYARGNEIRYIDAPAGVAIKFKPDEFRVVVGPAVGSALVARADKFEEIRALLNETHQFASTSPVGKQNISAALDLLDGIEESATGTLVAVKDEQQDQAAPKELTDPEIVEVLASLGIDSEPSKYPDNPVLQVRTSVPGIRRIVAAYLKRAAPTESAAAPADLIRAGWFNWEVNCWVATSSDDPRATILYRLPTTQTEGKS